MEDWVQNVILQWQKEGVKLNLGATTAEIETVESQINFKFPIEFKELYLAVNGFVDAEMRGLLLSLWSLSKILEDYNPSKNFIMFSDYFISVCQYGFDKDSGGIYKAYTYDQLGPVEFITESFQKMIGLFNGDSSDSDVLFG